ncbi:MAG: type IV pilus assembly protein PilB [Parcubacteria group bacterium Gr01-1014_38]|nr:MAG: type IV pilus assembly protein PilB [Parcubacteria group bacterium Gr01-1014_38]
MAEQRTPQSVEEILVEWGYLTPEQRDALRDLMARTGRTADDLLLSERFVPEDQFARAKGVLLGIPYVDLRRTAIHPDAVKEISFEAARTYQFIPFAKEDNVLHVALAQPENFQALEALKFLTKKSGLSTQIHIATASAVEEALSKSLGGLHAEVATAIQEFSQEVEEAGRLEKREERDLERILEEAPATKAVAVIIRYAIEGRASDIHIEPEPDNLRIRFRVDGVLHTSLVLPLKVHSAIASRIKILSNLKIDEQRLPQDGRFSTTAGGHEYDFRVSVMPTTLGEKVALRILDKSQGALPFETLGYRGRRKDDLLAALSRPYGLFLITGPTGSGKSTTLFTALDHLNKPDVNIVTLEDPVEYHVAGVNQTQVNPDIGLAFASGLRSILRQDPDIIMVGEIRDLETAELAVHSALTGHLVLSTLHTNDAVGAVPRLLDMGVEPFLLAAILRLVGAQRLVRRICPHCRVSVPLSDETRAILAVELRDVPTVEKAEENLRTPSTLAQGQGCTECGGTGTTGRIAIVEVVPVSEEFRNAIIRRASHDELRKLATAAGYLTMRQDGILKALAGEVPLEEVLGATSED